MIINYKMAKFGPSIPKSEAPDKTPYTSYYPHTISSSQRNWNQDYYQYVSIDPARKNFAFRIERRYHNGWITPIAFDKVPVECIDQEGTTAVCNTYQMITAFLDKFKNIFIDCHFIVIERQLPENYKATRIAQHTISYFSILLHNCPLLPSIIEIDPKMKGKILGAPNGITKNQLKSWAVVKARELLTIRKDTFSLNILDCFRNKQDDLSDTVCQLEALVISWGFKATCSPPPIIDNKIKLNLIDDRNKNLQMETNNLPIDRHIDNVSNKTRITLKVDNNKSNKINYGQIITVERR